MALKIDLGLRTYEICDADENVIGVIRFNPADMGFVSRWQEFQTCAEALEHNPPKTPADLEKKDVEMKALLDKTFAAPVSDVLFQGLSCFALCVDGRFVLENVLEAIVPEVRDAIASAQKEAEKRISKHTAAYEGSTAGLAPGQSAD